MEKEQKIMIVRFVLSAIFLVLGLCYFSFALSLTFYLSSFLVVGYSVVINTVKNISHGEIFDENFLMLIASIGAFVLGEFIEGVAIMYLYQVGEFLQDLAVDKSKDAIGNLVNLMPNYAMIEKDGKLIKVDPKELSVGDVIVVGSGEKIPFDGVVVSGESDVNTSALTGESVPDSVGVGDKVLSGCINLNATLKIKIESKFEDSTAFKIVEMVQNAEDKKSKTEKFISKFAKVYTPIVCAIAMLILLVPSLITGDWAYWAKNAITILIISCPCALVISVPLSFFASVGGLSKNGVLVKGVNYIETLSKIDAVAFDKTGTLTKGNFKITLNHPNDMSEKDLIEICALCEYGSNHPIAEAVVGAVRNKLDLNRVQKSEALPGLGVKAVIDGKQVYVGNDKLLQKLKIKNNMCSHAETTLHIVIDSEYAGHIVVADEIKENAKYISSDLKNVGVEKVVVLTGDKESVANDVAKSLAVDYRAELKPNDKVKEIENLKASGFENVCFVGDGINDAPVLKKADIGVAMGMMGSDIAVGFADAVVLDDNIKKVPLTISHAKKTMRIVKENIIFALFVKIAVITLGAVGLAPMWSAVLADVGVSIIAILNAIRCFKVNKKIKGENKNSGSNK